MTDHTDEIQLDLLIKRFTEGLTPEEERELNRLEAESPADPDGSIESTAATISMLDVDANAQLPQHLRAKILTDAREYFSREEEAETRTPVMVRDVGETTAQVSFWQQWFGWAVAAAACLVLAVNIYVTQIAGPRTNVSTATPTPSPVVPGPAEQRQQVLAAADVIRRDWSDFDPKAPRNVRGDVVWSNSLQKGFVRFENLPANDTARETYQLWIFDQNQNPKTPIDGGVFNASAGGEIIIPIDAKLAIGQPVMFAVTAEKPGGVVVSELGKVMAVAKV